MPSSKDPTVVVNPGPGRLPAGSVPAGALISPPGGGGGSVALAAHLSDPTDAHMASAIGINPYYPPTGAPILTTVGGVVDGESVLDFIYNFKDLIPVRPNVVGYNLPAGVNSGVPNWDVLRPFTSSGTARTGGYANGTTTVPTRYAIPTGSSAFVMTGMSFPADRGVLAFYKTTDGNFFNSVTTTLLSALWLGANPPPVGVPGAAFSEALRTGQQTNYTGSGTGINLFSLTYRLPYLSSYSAYPGAPYSVYSQSFYGYQLATYSLTSQAVSAGAAGSWLLVHWKETYASTLASIQPASLTALTLVGNNCYSAVPVASNFDDSTAPVINVNRRFVFRDSSSGSAPTSNTLTTLAANAPATANLSGISHVNSTTLQFDVTLAANGLFANTFQTGSVASPPDVPSTFNSASNPMTVSFSEFGGGTQLIPYYSLRKQGVPGNYSISNAPQTGDIGEYINAALSIASPTSFTPTNIVGYAKLNATLVDLFNSAVAVADASKRYLYNSYAQTGGSTLSTDTFEPFVDEKYRYISSYTASVATDPITPAGGNIFASATSLVTDTASAQIVTNNLTYPQINFSAASYYPAGNPNYSTLPGSDAVNAKRRYIRAFDTGIPRNVGKIRIRGLAQAAFQTNAAYDGTEATGHTTGGAIVQIKVPGFTGWLDLGRASGDPGVATTDFYGCQTTVTTSGPDLFVGFNTTAFTTNNGSGKFLLFIRVTLLNSVAGRALYLDELEWQP